MPKAKPWRPLSIASKASANAEKGRNVARIRKHAPEVAGSVAGSGIGATLEPARAEAPVSRKKRRPGAPKGNMNAAVHIGIRNLTSAAKAAARAKRDRDKRTSRRVSRELIEEQGVADRADAREAAWLYAEARTLLMRFLHAAGRASPKGKDGSPAAELSRCIEQLGRTVGLLEKLIAVCAENRPERPPDEPLVFRILSAAGEPVDFGFGQGAPRAAQAFDPIAGIPTPSPPPIAQPEPAVAAQSEPVPPIGTASKPRSVHPLDERTPLQRNWDNGLSPWGDDD